MLNKRQESIIVLLEDSKNWMTGKEISVYMNVSDRTIRSDIDAINKYYQKTLIESNLRSGYRINQEVFATLPIQLTNVIPQTPQERCMYVIRQLLFDKKEINLIDLQDKVYISGYTIDNDLKRIRKMIEPYENLNIIRSKNYISLQGSESSKRKLYKDLLTEETKGNFINMDNIVALYKDFDLMKAKRYLDQSFEKYDYHVRETSLPMLMIHIGVSIERMIHHNYVKDDNLHKDLKSSLEYQVAYDFYTRLSKHIQISLNEAEVDLLALLLLGKRSEEYTADIIEIKGKKYQINDLVDELVDDIYKTYDVDLRNDIDLKNGLRMHLRSLIIRTQNDVKARNVYLQEIKRKYPLVFEMGVHAGKFLKEKTGLWIEEDEIGFVALHLGSAYDRSNSNQKYRVLMVYPNDQALSNLSIQKVESRFSDRMEIVETACLFEERFVQKLNPDLILTTLPLKHRLDIPTVHISLFIDNEDESLIFQALNQLDKRKAKEQFETMILDLIKPDCFYSNVEIETREELIERMCKKLEEKGYVEADYKESVLQRENYSATSFNLGFALPHALKMNAIQSCISVAILKKPILWGEYQVQLVILLAIKDVDRSLLRIFFDWLTSVVSDSTKFSKLLQVSEYKEFINQVMEE